MKRIVLLLSPLVILLSPIIDAFQGVYIDPRSDAGYAVIACVAIIGLALGMIATVCYKRGAVGNVVTAGTLAVTLFLFGDLSYGVFWRLADHIGMGAPPHWRLLDWLYLFLSYSSSWPLCPV